MRLVREAPGRGVKVFIVGAGAAAHLAGVVAAHTILPVIGVPIDSSALKGLDALLSTVQMPPGVPVATVSIGKPGRHECRACSRRRSLASATPASRSSSTPTRRRSPTRSKQAAEQAARGTELTALRYAIVTFGCRVNQADSLRIEEDLRARGGLEAAPAARRSCRREYLFGHRHRRSGRAPDDPPHRARQSLGTHRRHRLLRDALSRRRRRICRTSLRVVPQCGQGSSRRTDGVAETTAERFGPGDGPLWGADRAGSRRSDCVHAAGADRLRGALRLLHHPDDEGRRPEHADRVGGR